MNYKSFISFLKTTHVSNIKPLYFPNSCAIEQVPDAFYPVLSEVISFIDRNIGKFCNDEQVFGLFGLQPASGFIRSNLPEKLNRVYYENNVNCHFCCLLNYMVLPKEQHESPASWQDHHSIVVDFTTGQIMDGDRFISLVFQDELKGKLLTTIDKKFLKNAWRHLIKVEEMRKEEKKSGNFFLFERAAMA